MQDEEILTILKIIVMIGFFLIVTIFGTLPLRSKNFKKRPMLRAIGSTFAGCLFLNVALMHILPEAADTLQHFLQDGDQHKQVFPLAYLLMMAGFILTVFFTKVLAFHSHQEDLQEQLNDDSDSSQDTDTSHVKLTRQQQQEYDKKKQQLKQSGKSQQQIKQSLLTLYDLQGENVVGKINKSQSMPVDGETKKKMKRKVRHAHTYDHNHNHSSHGRAHVHAHHNHGAEHGHNHVQNHHGINHEKEQGQQQQLVQPHQHHHLENRSMLNEAFILTIAIYFHTIFQGIAIGVQNRVTGFLSTAVAIAFHKWADALSMGLHYRTKNLQKKLAYTLIIVQAFLNVSAIGLGWIIASSGDVVEAIFLSISAGTFLAISTLEMLGEQFHFKQFIRLKFLLLVVATGFVASIWFVQNQLFGPSQ